MPKHNPSRSSNRKPKSGGRVIKVNVNTDLQLLNEHAAGIDIGAERHYVAVPPTADPHPVREFSVFTNDLYAIADWLDSCGVKSVAMESTGVYWVPLFEVLDERGFQVKLVDARKVKDWIDTQTKIYGTEAPKAHAVVDMLLTFDQKK